MKSNLPSGMVMSRSRVPDRLSRKVVMLVMRNMMMNGKRPSTDGPTRAKTSVSL